MDKNATTSYPVHYLIQRRWSPRSFAGKSVESEKIVRILEAARWSPSWRNDQPWRFIVATREHPEEYHRLLDCLKPGNQRWAGQAPVLMIAVAKRGYDHGPQYNPVTLYDTGQAVAQLTIEALSHGLYVHQMGGIHAEKICKTYCIPGTFTPIVALALGYLGKSAELPADLREQEEAPRRRLPLNEIAFKSSWGLPFSSNGSGVGEGRECS